MVAKLNVRATALQAAAACGYVSATSGQREAVHVVTAEAAVVEVVAVVCGGAVATWAVVYAGEVLAAAMAAAGVPMAARAVAPRRGWRVREGRQRGTRRLLLYGP